MFPPTSHPLIWDYIYWYGSTDLCHHCLPRTEFTSKMSPPPKESILRQIFSSNYRYCMSELMRQTCNYKWNSVPIKYTAR